MWKARYRLPNGKWQTWAVWEEWQEAKAAMEFHAQGREYEITKYRDEITKYGYCSVKSCKRPGRYILQAGVSLCWAHYDEWHSFLSVRAIKTATKKFLQSVQLKKEAICK